VLLRFSGCQGTGSGQVPVGTILAFFPVAGEDPPPGFVYCNGTTVVVRGKPFQVPDLNGERLFLRGGLEAGVMQGDALQGHGHMYHGTWSTAESLHPYQGHRTDGANHPGREPFTQVRARVRRVVVVVGPTWVPTAPTRCSVTLFFF
jgi:hypothetical protein